MVKDQQVQMLKLKAEVKRLKAELSMLKKEHAHDLKQLKTQYRAAVRRRHGSSA